MNQTPDPLVGLATGVHADHRDCMDRICDPRLGVFRSVPELIATIEQYLRVHNDDPKPFV